MSEMCERQQGVCKKLIPMATRRDKDYKLAARWPGNVTPKPNRPEGRGRSRGVQLMSYRRRLPGGRMSLVGRRRELKLPHLSAAVRTRKASLLAQTRHLCLKGEQSVTSDLQSAQPQPRCIVPKYCVSGRRPGLTQRAARRPDKVVEAVACGVDGTQERPRLRSAGIFASRATVPTAPLREGRWKPS